MSGCVELSCWLGLNYDRKLWDREGTAQPAWSSRGWARKVSCVLQGGDESEQHMGQSLERREPLQLVGTKSMVAHGGSSAFCLQFAWSAWIGLMLSSPGEDKGNRRLEELGSRWTTGTGMGKVSHLCYVLGYFV